MKETQDPMSSTAAQSSQAFDPANFDFILLGDFRLADGIAVYELRNHPSVNGVANVLRLNLYFSKDENFVTIWHGLLEPLFAEAQFSKGSLSAWLKEVEFDFGTYNEDLFRGYIDTKADAESIFRALRLREDRRFAAPQVLSETADGEMRCDILSTG